MKLLGMSEVLRGIVDGGWLDTAKNWALGEESAQQRGAIDMIESRSGMTEQITCREACLRIENSRSLEDLNEFLKRLRMPTVSLEVVVEHGTEVPPSIVVLQAVVNRTMELLGAQKLRRDLATEEAARSEDTHCLEVVGDP